MYEKAGTDAVNMYVCTFIYYMHTCKFNFEIFANHKNSQQCVPANNSHLNHTLLASSKSGCQSENFQSSRGGIIIRTYINI